MEINQAINLIQTFQSNSLKRQIQTIENSCVNKTYLMIGEDLSQLNVDVNTFKAALAIKQISNQIHVTVHTLGIMLSLPYILKPDEIILELSLGAGSAGKDFDLSTDLQIAEFKFIQWQERGNAVRLKNVFKDFFYLSEYDTQKKKRLYVINKEYTLRFLNGDRTIRKITNHREKFGSDFAEKHGDRFNKIYEYYQYMKDEVEIVDLLEILPEEISNPLTR